MLAGHINPNDWHFAYTQGMEDARQALDIARKKNQGLCLINPPDSCLYMGACFFSALLQQLSTLASPTPIIGIYDAGSNAGYALAAFQAGIQYVAFAGTPLVFNRLASIQQQRGGYLLAALCLPDLLNDG
ncbi:MAG: hypothetical protein ACOYK8_08615 [Alphaproteobacteria bacterium]